MRNIILAVVAICALTIAGIGGTFATWSDSETSMNNFIGTGSLDLKVNGHDDLPYGSGVPAKVELDHVIPCKVYGPFEVELWNAGECENWTAHAYIHFKDACCGNLPPKVHPITGESTGYTCPETGDLKPEPELVAEFGGRVNSRTVPGINVTGDDCSMLSHTYVWIMLDDTEPEIDVTYNTTVCAYQGKLDPTICREIYLFDLEPCVARTIYLWFHLQQESEEDYGLDIIPNVDPGHPAYQTWQKFNDWPSWALMKDVVNFNIEFDLWLEDP